ncbi:MAG: hypothetical protein ACW987_11560 [Candidatus Thorarchaeota archaeon]
MKTWRNPRRKQKRLGSVWVCVIYYSEWYHTAITECKDVNKTDTVIGIIEYYE